MYLASESINQSKKEIGTRGELLVVEYLKKYDFSILDRNYIIRGGELDIIARKNEVVVFVEVKTRSKNYFHTSEVITRSKQCAIQRTALHYIMKKQLIDCIFRFDVACVTILSDASCDIQYIQDAFRMADID